MAAQKYKKYFYWLLCSTVHLFVETRVAKVGLFGAFVFFLSVTTHYANADQNNAKGKSLISELSDVKDWKKLIRTKTNVLIYFVNGKPSSNAKQMLDILQDAAELIKGIGTIAAVDCSGETSKLCKKLKISPSAGKYVLKHYHNGNFNKDYDRAEKLSSVVNFLKDPTGDLPWDEERSARDILHFPNLQALLKTVSAEASGEKGILVMFYAPWCGFCKRLKPDYSQAATELKGEGILGAIDVNKPENSVVRQKYNITGFPTFLFFRNGELKQTYEGDNNKDSFVSFLRNPDNPQRKEVKPEEKSWSDEPSEVNHLTSDNFDSFLQSHASVLVMFYAPWCGHCKNMKPNYVAAAQKLKDENMAAVLAAVDATKHTDIAKKFDVKGYPTIKYFKDGALTFDANVRDEESIIKFMEDPKEAPSPPPPEKHWSEEESAVVHLDEENFKSVLRKKKNALVIFYAPWCGHCKHAKPEFTAAANDLKDDPKVLFAAVDCTKHNSLCKAYDVHGFPTFKKFHYLNKEPVEDYDGGRKKEDMVAVMSSTATTRPVVSSDWEGISGQENIIKLTEKNHPDFFRSHKSALVMFYAPWCGHCKTLKPEFALAASSLVKTGMDGTLASVNCDENPQMVKRYEIKGYPTLIYFRDGKRASEYNQGRKSSDIISFMKQKTKDEL